MDGTIKTEKMPFVIYADFETFLTPGSDGKLKNAIDTHVPSGFCCFTVSKYEKYNDQKPKLYSGPHVMDRFYQHLLDERERINEILCRNEPMKPLTHQQKILHNDATICITCHQPFTSKNPKVHHHCHVTGDYIGPACNNCNLQLKARHVMSGSNEKKRKNHVVDVVCHNLKSFDSHIIIAHFKRIAAGVNKNGSYRDIEVIAVNSERYISFEFNGFRFIDSFQFLPSSLDKLVANCALDGYDKFVYMQRWLSDSPLLIAKGVYPYEYMTGIERFRETELPPKEQFYSRLTGEHISDEDYDRAKQVWTLFDCKTLQDYHDVYLMTDVLLLAQVFESFRSMAIKTYGLDPAHYRTLPGFSWDALLKHSGIQLQLISDPEIFLFLENSIRGGVSTVSHRYATANDPRLPTFDSTRPRSYITYLDVNNLYGYAMTQALPIGDFRFLSHDEIDHLDIDNISDDATQGYILEVDLSYPRELHRLHSDFPVAPERLKVTHDMLSPYCKSLALDHVTTEKLVPNLYDKVKYVTHYRNLKLYKRLGLKVTKIHRVLTFTQAPWMRSFIELNTRLRQQSKSEFEKDFFKLMNNAVFGKSMENVRNRQNYHLVCCERRAKKLIARPTFKSFDIINEDLVLIQMSRPKITLNKPIYTGFSVLDLSKELMYSFYYDTIKKRYGDRSTLLFTDTDSLCLHIQTDDLYSDMLEDLDKYDTSNYEKENLLYSAKNAKVVGKMKDECGGKPIAEFVGLRAKMYSLLIPNEPDKLRCKGVKKSYIKQNLRHSTFLKALTTGKSDPAEFYNFRSYLHKVHTVRIRKKCLSAFDDKRYILSDGFRTLAYGHWEISCESEA
jgi:hypothetical protein